MEDTPEVLVAVIDMTGDVISPTITCMLMKIKQIMFKKKLKYKLDSGAIPMFK